MTLRNGHVSYSREPRPGGMFLPGTVLTYSCNSGYYRVWGTDTRTCQSYGLWKENDTNWPGPVICHKGNGNL